MIRPDVRFFDYLKECESHFTNSVDIHSRYTLVLYKVSVKNAHISRFLEKKEIFWLLVEKGKQKIVYSAVKHRELEENRRFTNWHLQTCILSKYHTYNLTMQFLLFEYLSVSNIQKDRSQKESKGLFWCVR